MALMKATVCLPTYNERENVERMVRSLHALDVQVLVIDDNSPDGTGELADGLARELEGVAVLHRPHKDGLGPAYIAGFHRALADGAELILEMDCDFSHDPADVPRLIAASDTADVTLGSRYVAGGGVENWALRRRIQSRGGCAYARLILGVPVRDLTGGFKCWRRGALEAVDLNGVDAHGYGFQIEMTYRAIKASLSVTEVPIVFRERREGQSKMSAWITLEAVWKVPALRLRG